MNNSNHRAKEFISIFDIFKIGIGPSSSHTMGPWIASMMFLDNLNINEIVSIEIELYGSLAKTGIGHGTDLAVILGLLGYHPTTIKVAELNNYINEVYQTNQLSINGKYTIDFSPTEHIIFDYKKEKLHPNTLIYKAKLKNGKEFTETYHSVGGGFVVVEGGQNIDQNFVKVPFPIHNYDDLLVHINATGKTIPEIVLQNELIVKSEEKFRIDTLQIWNTMLESVYKGCHTKGKLPGGLDVQRRAFNINASLLKNKKYATIEEWIEAIKTTKDSFVNVNKWISCFALAVNEENASFGRVVTAPTNGASGVIPAVILYMLCFLSDKDEDDIIDFIVTAGEIGSLFKKGSTISAAMGGCQAEIGVSSAMAAAGLTQCLGGSYQQVLMAAEISMEHHLGLTCDPIGGLVQIPCIERNTMGAIKAITASQIALESNPDHAKVNLKDVIQTMWETALDMNSKYKETSEGGLAINVPIIVPEC